MFHVEIWNIQLKQPFINRCFGFQESKKYVVTNLVGGFNPFEKYYSQWESSPSSSENKKYLKPPPRVYWGYDPLTKL